LGSLGVYGSGSGTGDVRRVGDVRIVGLSTYSLFQGSNRKLTRDSRSPVDRKIRSTMTMSRPDFWRISTIIPAMNVTT
jgi:hypothetical protein